MRKNRDILQRIGKDLDQDRGPIRLKELTATAYHEAGTSSQMWLSAPTLRRSSCSPATNGLIGTGSFYGRGLTGSEGGAASVRNDRCGSGSGGNAAV